MWRRSKLNTVRCFFLYFLTLGLLPAQEATAPEATSLRSTYEKPTSEWPTPHLDPSVEHHELGSLPPVEHPPENPHTETKERLGRFLFFDPRLSSSQQISCASCHDPDLGWADGRRVGFGHHRQPTARNTPSILNAAHKTSQFWDGRSASLEDQAMDVIHNPKEMDGSERLVVPRLEAQEVYRKMFEEAFGEPGISLTRIAMALATFERSLVSKDRSRFDQFLAGKSSALTDSAIRGLHLFRTTANCMNCHSGPTLSDGKFHDLGLSFYGRELEDLGRYKITGKPEDVGAFITPGLRGVAQTRPYMHNGLFELRQLLVLYNAGMPTLKPKGDQVNDPLFPKKSHLLKPLGLKPDDLADLQAFLESLSEPPRTVKPPDFPPL